MLSAAILAGPRTDRGYHPLCAVYTRGSLEPVARRLADGRLKMIDLFEDVRVRYRDLETFRGHQR
jgi:molybdopterin-guanine dinucleotide biosynthesis protein A